MKVIIFGASGSGTTTLSQALAEKLNWPYLDADDYYWEKTNPPFQVKVPFETRNQNLKSDFIKSSSVIVSGSLATWSDYWNVAFNLGVFLKIPHDLRMERLRKRELERYGSKLKTDNHVIKKSNEFLSWAEKYDDESFEGRSISQHKEWIELLDCEVIELDGDLSTKERIGIIIKKINPGNK